MRQGADAQLAHEVLHSVDDPVLQRLVDGSERRWWWRRHREHSPAAPWSRPHGVYVRGRQRVVEPGRRSVLPVCTFHVDRRDPFKQ